MALRQRLVPGSSAGVDINNMMRFIRSTSSGQSCNPNARVVDLDASRGGETYVWIQGVNELDVTKFAEQTGARVLVATVEGVHALGVVFGANNRHQQPQRRASPEAGTARAPSTRCQRWGWLAAAVLLLLLVGVLATGIDSHPLLAWLRDALADAPVTQPSGGGDGGTGDSTAQGP